MIEIPITKGYATFVSDEDADLSLRKWSAETKRKKNGYISVYVVRGGSVDKKQYRVHMHRFILERVLGRALEKHEFCDHIDKNSLNNTRENLRVSTVGQNNCNLRVRVHSTTGYMGVSWSKLHSKYEAYINFNKTRTHLGLFADPIKAAQARDRAAIQYHGDFASLNFPRSLYEQEPS